MLGDQCLESSILSNRGISTETLIMLIFLACRWRGLCKRKEKEADGIAARRFGYSDRVQGCGVFAGGNEEFWIRGECRVYTLSTRQQWSMFGGCTVFERCTQDYIVDKLLSVQSGLCHKLTQVNETAS